MLAKKMSKKQVSLPRKHFRTFLKPTTSVSPHKAEC
jgi:hypothetical protein